MSVKETNPNLNMIRQQSLIGTAFKAKANKLEAKNAAFVLVIDETTDTLLVVDSHNRPDMMHLPGGKLEPGETPLTAAKRELKEELGLEVRMFELEERIVYYSGEMWRETFFVAFVHDLQPVKSSEIKSFGWISISDFVEAAQNWGRLASLVDIQEFTCSPVNRSEIDPTRCRFGVAMLGDDCGTTYCPERKIICRQPHKRDGCEFHQPVVTVETDWELTGHYVHDQGTARPIPMENPKLVQEAWRRLWLEIPISIDGPENLTGDIAGKVLPPVMSKVLAYALGLVVKQ